MISIIIPTYNERENIKRLVPRINRILAGREMEILVVDDNSPDGTAQEAAKFRNVRVISQSTKRGIGYAHCVGYRLAKGHVLVTMDADLSHDPKEIPKMLALIDAGFDVVVGSRYVEGGKTDKRPMNVLVSYVGGRIAATLFGLGGLRDYTTGFRAFRKKVYLRTRPYSETGNALLMEFLIKAASRGFRIVEIPIDFKERKIGVSKTNLYKESLRTAYFILKTRITP